MFCSNCGKELRDGDKFCSGCGYSVLRDEKDFDELIDDDPEEAGEDSDIVAEIDGTDVNITEILNMFNGDKESAVTYLIEDYGIDSWTAKDIIDDAYEKSANSWDNVVQVQEKSALKSFWEKAKERNAEIARQSIAAAEKRREEIAQQKEEERFRIQQLDRDGIAYCPKCHSTSLSAHKKGFGVGKAVVGGALLGPIGLVAGNAGAKKVRVTCMKCGHQFWAGRR